ncbi:MAG: cobinamide kinase [Clostridiales bacterium]|nr:cobinamide kinase [Clostridiales bacterium]
MILVIGGLASGKRSYVRKEFGFGDSDMADGVLDSRPVLFNLQNLVFKAPDSIEALLPSLLLKKVVICNEVGSGVVPVDKAERIAREATGRLCVALAEQAEKVIRLCCGVPAVIKEQ